MKERDWRTSMYKDASCFGHLGRRHVSDVPDGVDRHATRRPDGDPREAAVVQTESQPGFRRELKSATDEVADHVGMTDEDLVGVLLLLRIRATEVAAEGGFDPRTVFEVLLCTLVRQTADPQPSHDLPWLLVGNCCSQALA